MRIVSELKAIAQIGDKFCRLKIIGRPFYSRKKHNASQWAVCECDCGKIITAQLSKLRNGHTTSCGCRQRDINSLIHRKHGSCKTSLYFRWSSMIQRCTNPNCKAFRDYGGRGITVCEEWERFEPFKEWAEANGYRQELEIDRRDNNGNYEPGNCRWITRTKNMRNKRTGRNITAFGETKSVSAWVEDSRCVVTRKALTDRIGRQNMDAEAAITVPPKLLGIG